MTARKNKKQSGNWTSSQMTRDDITVKTDSPLKGGPVSTQWWWKSTPFNQRAPSTMSSHCYENGTWASLDLHSIQCQSLSAEYQEYVMCSKRHLKLTFKTIKLTNFNKQQTGFTTLNNSTVLNWKNIANLFTESNSGMNLLWAIKTFIFICIKPGARAAWLG